ncbi:MAG: hypothetical protein QOI95_2155 [Acidimicrobiaceae bacterium]|jgi:hypothetical protein
MTARAVPVPKVWGIGLVGAEAWRVSPEDVADETESAVEHLRLLGIREGGLVLIVSRLAETIHVAPLELAAGRLDARWSSCDATEGDAFRTASLIRQLRPDAVIGITETIVGAVTADAFDDVPVIAVTDRVARDAIPTARWWLRVGPTSAFECEERNGAHYDGTRWLVEQLADELVVSNLRNRLSPARQLPTGLRGRVLDDACPCGSSWPRVEVS